MTGVVDWATGRARMILAFVLLSLPAGWLAYSGLPKEGEPDLAVPGAADDIRAFSEIAMEQGGRKVVLLSGRGVTEAEEAEQVVAESGLDWTFVRAAWFSQNFSEGEFAQMIRDGVIALPMGDAVEPIVDVDDIAEVVAASLTDAHHNGETFDVTGPEALTHKQIATELSNATGRQVQ